MKISVTACVLLLTTPAVIACSQVSADVEAEFPLLKGLDTALELADSLPSVALCLSPSEAPFTVGVSAAIGSRVAIQGNSQAIRFLAVIEVSGSLTILNATITADLNHEEFSLLKFFGGALHIEESSVTSLNAALIKGSGSLTVVNTNITGNTAPIAYFTSVGDAILHMQDCTVWNHSGEFFLISPHVNSGSISVSIERTTFRESQGSGFLFSCSAPLLPTTFSVTETRFSYNNVALLYLDINNALVTLKNTEFLYNNQTTLTVIAKGSVLMLEDSIWRGNSQIVFDILQFTGDLQVTRVTVTDQRWKGIFQLINGLSSEQCRFSMQNSSFLDTYFKVDEPSPGIIGGKGCIVLISGVLIDNVRMAATRQRDVKGLITMRFGALVISKLTLRSSGAAGAILAVMMANFTLTDSYLHEAQSGGGLYILAWVGSLVVHNVNISHGAYFPLDEESLNPMIMPISSSSSYLEVRNVQILPSQWYNRANGVFSVYSTVNISGITVHHRRYETFLYFLEVEGLVSNVTMHDCFLDASVIYACNSQPLKILDLTVNDSIIGFQLSHGIFAGTPIMNIECIDLYISNVTAVYLAGSKQALARFANVSILDSHFNYFLKNQLDSDITIEKMSVRRSSAILAYLYRSSLRIVDSVFEDFESRSVIIGGENVNITLDGVVMKNVASPSGFCRFREKSQLVITRSSLSNYRSAADEGFYHNTGSLRITESSFHSFNTVFIQAKSCSVYIGNSVFQEGRGKAMSRTSASAFGGALACVGCPSVVVENSSFLNVSSIFGGAIAVRSTNTLYSSSAVIRNCEFVMCTATAGGALYVKESSLYLEKSKFIGNVATSTGGAIEVFSSKEHSTAIRNCEFYRNSAHEGGAVKWSEAEVLIANTTFQGNTAFYGPDIASYGIVFSGSVSSSESGSIVASGHPLQLVFELQDHYGQRVLTTSTQDLQLVKSDQVNFLGNIASTINQGVFNFSQLTIYAQPNSTQQVLGTMSANQNGQIVLINASIYITFRDCVSGEVRKADRCEYCFAGNLSLYPSDQSCRFCPNHAFCPGGNALIIDSHYWRNSTNSVDIVKCPLRLNCLGGQNSECAEGYTGKVCNECSEGYTRHRTLNCEPCRSYVAEWGKVILAAVPIVGFYSAIQTASDTQFFVLKQIINHAQMLSVLSYLRVSYPTVIKNFLHSLSYLSSLFVSDLPISCISPNQPEYTKAIIGSALPSAFILLAMLLHRKDMRKGWILCTSSMMFTPIISLISQMPLLACQHVLSEEEYLFVDMQKKCWESRHLLLASALVLPSAILNVMLPIALVSAISIVSPRKFDDLFPLWRSGVKWRSWDLFMYCAKVMLIGLFIISVTIEQLCQVAYGLVVLIFVSVCIAGVSRHAYIHWKWFFLVEHSLVIVSVSIGLCAYFIYHHPTEGLTDWLIIGCFAALNVGFFAVCLKLLIHPPDLASEIEICPISVPPNSLVDSLSIIQMNPAAD